jgi:hypothetical protein
MRLIIVTFTLSTTILIFLATAAAVTDLRHYETLHTSEVSHRIGPPGVAKPGSSHKFSHLREVAFTALGRHFRLILWPQKGLLSPSFRAVEIGDDDEQEIFVSVEDEAFYEGHVVGEAKQSRPRSS